MVKTMDVISLTNAFLTRDLDFETSFTYAYSKIVGLQAGGPLPTQTRLCKS